MTARLPVVAAAARRAWRLTRQVIAALLAVVVTAAAAGDGPDTELAVLRARIDEAREAAAEIAGRRDRALAAVQAVEVQIATVEESRRELATRRDEEQREAARLGAELDRLRAFAQRSREDLAGFLRARHRIAGASRLRTLLSLERPADVSRMAAYHRYLAAWQERRIAEFDGAAADIEAAVAALNASRARLAALERGLDDDRRRLAALQTERQAKVAALEGSLSDQRRRIDTFEREAARLATLVRELAASGPTVSPVAPAPAAAAPAPAPAGESFAAMRGRLGWPVAAAVRYRFGEPRAETGLPWKGTMLDVEDGQTVHAVYAGNVVFADWFPAFGLLLIIDHGDGYMSLYAHLGRLMKSIGDPVATGEAVAVTGSTGGLGQSALYFEIRHNGEPRDPGQWCRRA